MIVSKDDIENTSSTFISSDLPLSDRIDLYNELLKFLRDTVEDLSDLIDGASPLSANVDWLLQSKSWKIGHGILHPFYSILRTPHRALLRCQLMEKSTARWIEARASAYSMFLDTLVVVEKFNTEDKRNVPEDIITKQTCFVIEVLRELIAEIDEIDAALSTAAEVAMQTVVSKDFRMGHFLVNSIAKRITNNPSRLYDWAPDRIQEIHTRVLSACDMHEKRFQDLHERVFSRFGIKLVLEPSIVACHSTSFLSNVSLHHQGPLRPLPLSDQPVLVLVPIYNAYEVLAPCIESLLAHTDPENTILLVDDCSPDKRVWPLLQEYASIYSQITAHKNPQTIGFAANINQGFTQATGDIVIVKSDTEVTSRWVEKLRHAAYSKKFVATVTPLSNSGSAFSVPVINAATKHPDFLDLRLAADIVERCSQWLRPEVPTGKGPCLYIRREALDQVGLFDVESFQEGYGEEIDFCMRAFRKGFVHLIDDATYIYHKENASSLESSKAYKRRALETIHNRYPEYVGLIAQWSTTDSLSNLRFIIKSIWQGQRSVPMDSYLSCDDRETLLYIVHDSAGGTIHHLRDLVQGTWKKYRCLILYTGNKKWTLKAYLGKEFQVVDAFNFDDDWRITHPMNAERNRAIEQIINAYRPGIVHIHHFMWNSPEIIPLFKRSQAKVLLSLHDYYIICPSYNLLDQENKFCSGVCTSGEGICRIGIQDIQIDNLKHDYVKSWQDSMSKFLTECDHIISFSNAGKEIVSNTYPHFTPNQYPVISHGQDLEHFRASTRPSRAPSIRVVLLGTIGLSKGLHLIKSVLAINKKFQSPFEFHFVGTVHPDLNPERYDAIAHGAYERSELPDILSRIQPSYAMIASVWAETFCFTLSECWAAGLPVMASDLGTLRERILLTGGGWLLDHNDAQAWFDRMVEISQDHEGYEQCIKRISVIHAKTTEEMNAEYESIYGSLIQQ